MKQSITPWMQLIIKLLDIRTKYENIKQDEELRKNSVTLGWNAIGYCIWFAVFVAIAIGLGSWGIQYINTIAIFLGLVAIIIAVIFAVYSLVFLPLALSASIKQVKLNRRFIGIFSLVLTLLLTIAVTIVIILVANKIK